MARCPRFLVALVSLSAAACHQKTDCEDCCPACNMPEAPPACGAVDSSPSDQVLEVTVENRLSTTVYWAGRSGCDPTTLEVRDASGVRLALERSCDGANSCPAAFAVKLPPGARETVPVPLDYFGDPGCEQEALVCTRRLPMPADTYTAGVTWFDGIHAGDCEPAAAGEGCVLGGVTGTGTRHELSASWSIPDQLSVLLVIE